MRFTLKTDDLAKGLTEAEGDAAFGKLLDLAGQGLDALIEQAPVRSKPLDDAHHAGGKRIGRCGQDAR